MVRAGSAVDGPLLNHDLDAANQLLDEIGLTNKDDDGFRLGPDGKPITFLITTEPHAGEWEIAGQLCWPRSCRRSA